jgi:DNA-binding response OmpR family regulator
MIYNSEKKVLIIDNDQDINFTFKTYLEHYGYKVEAYNEGETALKNFRINSFDLLLIDIYMPQLNGFQLYNKIKLIDKNVKVCFMTPSTEESKSLLKKLHQFNNMKILRKPIKMNELIRCIEESLTENDEFGKFIDNDRLIGAHEHDFTKVSNLKNIKHKEVIRCMTCNSKFCHICGKLLV